jgi:ATP-binding cassette, subfamily B, bacterial MsbA
MAACYNVHMTSQGFTLYKRLFAFTRRYWKAFMVGIIGTILLSLIDAGFAWLIKPIINKGFIGHDMQFIKWLPVIVVSVFLLRAIAGFSSSYYIVRVARHVVMDFRQKIFSHLMRLPAKFYDKNTSGHLLSTIIYNVEQVSEASANALLILLRESALAIGLITVMFIVSWQLSLFFIVVAPLMAFAIKITGRRMRRLSTNVQDAVGDVSHIAEEGISAYHVIRVYGGEAYETNKFNAATKTNRQRELKVAVTNSIGTSIVQILVSIPIACVLWFATMPSMHISAGAFAAMIAALLQLLRPIRRLTLVNTNIQAGLAAVASIFTLLDEALEPNHGTEILSDVQGRIVFNDVSFDYGQDAAVLKNINFNLAPGKTLALVGPSGAGKTTLINLLPRFYECTKGSIYFDDQDITHLTLESLRSSCALVSQHSVLFNDTIAHNIAYGSSQADISLPAIKAAAKAANALAFIEALPAGFDTLVGENGVLLSGGQRQRIAIARALLKDAPILILDEATSSLDSQSEQLIQGALDLLMKGRTTIVIAHRLSTIEHADTILVMDAGRIIEQGDHLALLAKNGMYANLHRIQFSKG